VQATDLDWSTYRQKIATNNELLACRCRVNNAPGLVVAQHATQTRNLVWKLCQWHWVLEENVFKCHWIVKYADRLHPQTLTDQRIIAALRLLCLWDVDSWHHQRNNSTRKTSAKPNYFYSIDGYDCPPESVPAKTEVEANEFNLINLLDINLKVEWNFICFQIFIFFICLQPSKFMIWFVLNYSMKRI
jgi:hypothetical protein